MNNDRMENLYTPGTVDQWKEAKTMEHASGIWGRDYMLKELANIINEQDKIVDIGSGTGYPSLRLAEMARKGSVTGVELSKSMLGIEENLTPLSEKYKGQENLNFVNGDLQELPITDESSDVVTSFMVLHNLTIDEIKNSFKEIQRILKSGGKSIHLTMHPDIFNSDWDLDFMKYDKKDLAKLKSAKEKEGVRLGAVVKNAGGGEKKVGMYYHTFKNIRKAAEEAGLEIVNEKPLFIDEKTAKEKFGEDSVTKIPENPAFLMITLEKINSLTVQEMSIKLRRRNDEDHELPQAEVVELCFTVVEQHPDMIEQCRAAVILSGIVKKGLGKRTQQFLKDNPELPDRVHEILSAAIMRMECF